MPPQSNALRNDDQPLSTTPGRAAAEVVPKLLTVGKLIRALIGMRLAEAGFHNGQDELLLALEPNAPLAVSALADRLNVRPSTVSKMLDRMSDKGVMLRHADPVDARRTMIEITPLGIECRTRVLAIWRAVEDELVGVMSPAEVDAALDAVGRLGDRLSQRLMRLR